MRVSIEGLIGFLGLLLGIVLVVYLLSISPLFALILVICPLIILFIGPPLVSLVGRLFGWDPFKPKI